MTFSFFLLKEQTIRLSNAARRSSWKKPQIIAANNAISNTVLKIIGKLIISTSRTNVRIFIILLKREFVKIFFKIENQKNLITVILQ